MTGDPLISIRNLVRVYDGRRASIFGARHKLRAVDGVSLDVPRGRTLGIVGESGCGKSTLARMMVGLLPPTEGEILIGGQPIGGYDRRALSRRIQMVFQDPDRLAQPRRTVRRTLGGAARSLARARSAGASQADRGADGARRPAGRFRRSVSA